MGKLASILTIAAGLLVLAALFVVFVLDGAGMANVDTAYDPSGTIRHNILRTLLTRQDAYWKPDGSLDLDRSGRRFLGWRWRPLSDDEVRRIRMWRQDFDLACLNRAVATYMHREEGLTGNPQIDNTAWARKPMAPASLSEVVAYAPSRNELLGSKAPLRDAWGREYLLRVDPDSDTPFADAVRITTYTRGSDGTPGGEGDAADEGIEHSWRGVRIVSSIP